MDKYYYVIAQLPMLSFDKPSPMTIEHFLDETKKWLSPRDYSTLSGIELDDTQNPNRGSATLRMVRLFEHRFRRDLALWRQSQKKDGEYKPEAFNLSLVQEGNPLEIERKLLRWRWDFIDTVEKDHHFDLDTLILYFLKLWILKRLSIFNKEIGLERFRNLVSAELDQYETGQEEDSAEQSMAMGE